MGEQQAGATYGEQQSRVAGLKGSSRLEPVALDGDQQAGGGGA
jgi:hypothetical protein